MADVYRDPTPDQLQDLHDAVVDAVTTLADKISVPYGGLAEDDPRWATCMSTPEWQLAMLRALRELEPLMPQLGERWARTAGILGASYTQLAAAAGISRQAATKRWPGAVPPKDAAPVDIETAGGTGRVIYDQENRNWAWTARGANGASAKSDDAGHATSEAAAAEAGAFLAANATAEETN
ncbi:hypothetical protein [Streptomyces sp. ME19-01-6]|uniref:hypothetical protein n=1 Tax=Streptomyces sp. ME19-01-6 TaxID=3028686 RepID=UPI0029B8B1BC|nr:hypothetical protein [Streptomyces sp. ME19-01-6]MDX3232492.1 hypothetical protein [Streptomyces sp. ME19-01-6]